MRPAVILIPGNMCDARLWDGGAGILRRALADHGLAIIDADTTRDATIEAMALRALAAFCHSPMRMASVTTGSGNHANGANPSTVAAPASAARIPKTRNKVTVVVVFIVFRFEPIPF